MAMQSKMSTELDNKYSSMNENKDCPSVFLILEEDEIPRCMFLQLGERYAQSMKSQVPRVLPCCSLNTRIILVGEYEAPAAAATKPTAISGGSFS